MNNHDIAHILRQIAIYLAADSVPFKPRAYERAAKNIASLNQEVRDIYKEKGRKGLTDIPGVGENIALKIEEIVKTGRLKYQQQLKKKLPVNVEELEAIEGIGPKTIGTLYKKLKIKSINDLERAAKRGEIKKLAHFGQKSEQKILKGVTFLKKNTGRLLLGEVLPIAQSIEKRLKQVEGVKKAVVAGSIRRRQETIGDIDIVIGSTEPKNAINAFVNLPEVSYVYAKGPTKALVRLSIGIDADLRVVPPECFGAALQYFTGDKQHNIEVRKIAIKKGYKLSEYGLFSAKGGKLIAAHTEDDIYRKLGMKTPRPELRIGSG